MGMGRIPLFVAGAVLAGVAGVAIVSAVCAANGASQPQAIAGTPPAHIETAANVVTTVVRPTQVGINLPVVAPSSFQRVYANLAAHAEWMYASGGGWQIIDPTLLDAHGWVRSLPPGAVAPLPLIRPAAPFTTTRIKCTYQGKGSLGAGGVFRVQAASNHGVELLAVADPDPAAGGWLTLLSTDPKDPLRALDCREADMPKDILFAPEFIAYVRQFATVRFLDWSGANENKAGNWARRNTPDRAWQGGSEGVAVEHQVELANQADADGWFVLPYNADRAYIENFARYVHDHLKPGRVAYVELGNEIWNPGFPAARQAMREGQAEHLGAGNPSFAMMQRYAEKSRDALSIWTQAFADNPARLVRVVSTQNVWTDTARQVLGFKDTARYVDALATAPYFQLDVSGYAPADLDRVFRDLDAQIDKAIDLAAENRSIAAHYGKRFIAYEGGQHLVSGNIEFAKRIQRDPRMGRAYMRYLEGWRARVGDLMTLYAATAPISPYGSWGLREYGGQPIDQAPKLQAVREFLGKR
ncbi:MAG: hypothetical protein JWR77_1735 [Rhizorhabdus sp.]|nr:hypothetical protein [Rhizorhabdus sp.]